jgi:uncharacterized protein (TIGR02118 family)
LRPSLIHCPCPIEEVLKLISVSRRNPFVSQVYFRIIAIILERKEEPIMMKVTVIYSHPKSPEEFEKYYESTHLPLAAKMKGVDRLELTKFLAAPDGGSPAFYRMAELYFTNQAQMEQSLGSTEGQATVADLKKFATGGVTLLIGSV